MDLLGIKLGLTAAYHPLPDGQSEKTNYTVETALQCFIVRDTSKYTTWTKYIPIIGHEFDSMVHTTIGFTPNELRFGLSPRSIVDAYNPAQLASANESAEELADDLRNRREEARDSIAAARRK